LDVIIHRLNFRKQKFKKMTIHLEISKKNKKKILRLLSWLEETGLIKSFKTNDVELDGELMSDTEAEDFLMGVINESEEDVKKGNTHTNEEAQQKIKKWLKSQK